LIIKIKNIYLFLLVLLKSGRTVGFRKSWQTLANSSSITSSITTAIVRAWSKDIFAKIGDIWTI
jgi:hypothetical protein